MLALVLALALFQSAQPQQQTSPQMGAPKSLADATAEKCIIEGLVSSSTEGTPLKKAEVTRVAHPFGRFC